MKTSQGMTLLEMLVSLGVFTFMVVFITQAVKQSQRHVQKIKKNTDSASSFNHVIDLIRKDFNSVDFFFDLNDGFRKTFPIRKTLQEPLPSSAVSKAVKKASSEQNRPVFLSPYFVFKGEEDEMEFVSYSLTGSSRDQSLKQWIQIRYFVQDCSDLDKSSVSPCFLRSSKRSWSLEEEREEEEALVLLRDFKSLKFFYLNGKGFLAQDWKDSWKLERFLSLPNSSFEFPQELPFPFRIKIEMEIQERKLSWVFNVSNFYLRSWNPFSKEFFSFPKWEPSKKEKEPKPSVRLKR